MGSCLLERSIALAITNIAIGPLLSFRSFSVVFKSCVVVVTFNLWDSVAVYLGELVGQILF